MSIRDCAELADYELSATEKHLLGVLDWGLIDRAADWAALQLGHEGVASLVLCPGDATRYPFIITSKDLPWFGEPQRDPYLVVLASSIGAGYPWGGIELHHDYCASKWGREHGWTGWVVSEFLTALSRSIRALEEA